MKFLILSLMVAAVCAELPRFRPARFRFQRQELAPTTDAPAESTTEFAGYAASGWKPAGEPFTLPKKKRPQWIPMDHLKAVLILHQDGSQLVNLSHYPMSKHRQPTVTEPLIIHTGHLTTHMEHQPQMQQQLKLLRILKRKNWKDQWKYRRALERITFYCQMVSCSK
uniref:Uncharacterized protein n=1 Tax=Picea sitchensis TaxID=3332 RepID=B8LPN6_PICSI|nr:unknown [Picea sitchensis]